ncbi:MAG: hypothetical protein AAF611_11915 [Bacteroidota bacterium]
MSVKFHYFLLLVFFSCTTIAAQSFRVDAGRSDFRIRNLHVAMHDTRDSIKISRTFSDSHHKYFRELFVHDVFYDNYYFFHFLATQKLKDRNDSKDFILMPEYKIVVHKSEDALVFTPYKDFFTDGGFTKTGETKIIHGIPVEKYRISPSFLKMEIWVGRQEKSNRITDFLNELKLLDAIPTDQKVIAIVNNTIEYGTEFLRFREKRQGWLDSEFERLLGVSVEVLENTSACYEKVQLDTIPLTALKNIPKKNTLSYKTVYKTYFKTHYEEDNVQKDTLTGYWGEDSAIFLQMYDVNNTEEDKFIFLKNQKISLTGPVEDGTFLVTNATKRTENNCSTYGTPLLVKKQVENGRELSTYLTSDKRQADICTIIMDEKSVIDTSYLFPKYKLPKGEVLKIHVFSPSYTYINEIETVPTSKKIKINVKK